MRFDDSLRTVLAADASTPFGAASAWRQLVDLIGRGRAPASPGALARLRAIRSRVPEATRAASARALAFAAPGPELVGLFAEEALPIAAPVLRTATIDADAWLALLPRLTPAQRSILRHRRDLPGAVARGLEQFGATDFVLPYDAPRDDVAAPVEATPAPADAPATPPMGEGPFVSVGVAALSVAAQALRQAPPAAEAEPNGFAIAELVARIDAFHRERGTAPPVATPRPAPDRFRFETDAAGVIRWVDGVTRAPVVGISLAMTGEDAPQVDGVAAGAFRRRTAFGDARLTIGGSSDAAGAWRISGTPLFDATSGRFTGYHGQARRPRPDESAAPRSSGADSLRQLVHELRTPTNAIAGFSELIELQLLGPVPPAYREQAGSIREHAADLVAAIDDLDTAARIESGALELRPGTVPLAPMIERVAADLLPLARMRGAVLALSPIPADMALDVDDRAAERLFGRLLSALVSCAAKDERLTILAMREGDARVRVVFDRPAALAALADDGLLSIDAEREQTAPGAPLLGTGFALRLAQNLAGELGGSLAIEAERLTLRLPAAVTRGMGQVSNR